MDLRLVNAFSASTSRSTTSVFTKFKSEIVDVLDTVMVSVGMLSAFLREASKLELDILMIFTDASSYSTLIPLDFKAGI